MNKKKTDPNKDAAAKPAKAPKPTKTPKPVKAPEPTEPVDPSETIEKSLRAVGLDRAPHALVRTDVWELCLVPEGEPPKFVLSEASARGNVIYRLTWRLFIYDVDQRGRRLIRDIKEQQVGLGKPEGLEDRDRLTAFWQGLRQALTQILGTDREAVEVLMPHDLLPIKLLERRSFRTAEQFARAAVGKSYLGRLLPAVHDRG